MTFRKRTGRAVTVQWRLAESNTAISDIDQKRRRGKHHKIWETSDIGKYGPQRAARLFGLGKASERELFYVILFMEMFKKGPSSAKKRLHC